MRKSIRTTLDEDLLKFLKIRAIELEVNMNDIIEALLQKYKDGEIEIEVKKK